MNTKKQKDCQKAPGQWRHHGWNHLQQDTAGDKHSIQQQTQSALTRDKTAILFACNMTQEAVCAKEDEKKEVGPQEKDILCLVGYHCSGNNVMKCQIIGKK